MESKAVERKIMIEQTEWRWKLEMSEAERVQLVRLLRLIRNEDLSQGDRAAHYLFLKNLNVIP